MKILAILWICAALLALIPVMLLLGSPFPVFSFLFLLIPLIAYLKNRDVQRLAIRAIPWKEYLRVTAVNLGLLAVLMLVFEPWSHTYQMLVEKALSASSPDATFGWLTKFPGWLGWAGMLAYSGLVSLFAEELCFRGWLLQKLGKSMPPKLAVPLQAALFTLPQCLASFLLPPLQGILYAVVYSFLGIGCIGGWAASRTKSIFPSLTTAFLINLILCVLIL